MNGLSESDPRTKALEDEDSQMREDGIEGDLIILGLESKNPMIKAKAQELNQTHEAYSKKEEEFRCQVLHIETITMMAKYQLIYIKMENFWKKLERLINCKLHSHKAVVFMKMKKGFLNPRINKNYVFFKFLAGVKKLSHVVERKETREKSSSFSNIFSFYQISRTLLKEKMKIHDLRDKINVKQLEINKVKKRISEGYTKNYSRKKTGKSKGKNGGRKKDKENAEVNQVYQKLVELQNDNNMLSNKIKLTENKVIAFMQELSLNMKGLKKETQMKRRKSKPKISNVNF